MNASTKFVLIYRPHPVYPVVEGVAKIQQLSLVLLQVPEQGVNPNLWSNSERKSFFLESAVASVAVNIFSFLKFSFEGDIQTLKKK
jgi:hypothetical protein